MIDKENMLEVLEGFADQVVKANALASDAKVEKEGGFANVVICGMGGSGLPGEILQAYLKTKVPIFLVKGYELPPYADKGSLVFCISYSGNTEETIACYREAEKKKLTTVVICSGGKLEELARANKDVFVKVPSGLQPRMALAYQFFPLLTIMQNSGMITSKKREVDETVKALSSDAYKKMGKQLAQKLVDKVPLVYASDRMGIVAYKWKIDFNENAKTHAFANVFPELNHNEMNAFEYLTAKYYLIILRDEDDHPKVKKRMQVTKQLIQKKGIDATEILIKGSSMLTKIFSGIHIGDWTSYFLAIKYGIDPTPVPMVEEFKKLIK
ncbi:bifunctional phosphoglucose/phosphomannose isomerase [Candidatus Woesearchaeota archaeon]|nr:bifunctional phosphoglucose/phosphomannose isomerase [Candidatus Woesearchaeota archaeon]